MIQLKYIFSRFSPLVLHIFVINMWQLFLYAALFNNRIIKIRESYNGHVVYSRVLMHHTLIVRIKIIFKYIIIIIK